MKIFFGGIIQGSLQGKSIYSQDYREKLKTILKNKYPDIEIFDPFENHNNSIDYNDDQAKETFYMHLDEIKSADLFLAYLPQASMGTAIEMWQANHHRIPIITISPMTTNWVIRLFAQKNFETVDGFEKFIQEDDLIKLLSVCMKATDEIEEKV